MLNPFFLKSIFNYLAIFIQKILKLQHHLATEIYGILPWQFCICDMCNYELMLKFQAKIKEEFATHVITTII